MDGAFGETTAVLLTALRGAAPDEARAPVLDPLLILALILIAGIAGGAIARRLRVPAITGNILAGALLGLTLFRNVDITSALAPLSGFAVSLIAITAGGHFSYRRMHTAMRRILLISILQVAGALVLCLILLIPLGVEPAMAMMLAVLATSSSPATIVAIVREMRAKGPAVKTLLASVSMDSSICILLFAIVEGALVARLDPDLTQVQGLFAGLQESLWHLVGSGLLGLALGALASWVASHSRFHGFSFMLVAVLLATGVSTWMGLSPLLTSLFFGAFLANTTVANEQQLEALEPIEPMLYTAFFTIAGVSLHLDTLIEGGLLFVMYVIARAVGKGLGAYLGAVLSGTSPRIRDSIPFAFVPQAGVALGLVVVLQTETQIPEEFSTVIVTLVLASVTINEIIGPSMTRWSLLRAKEAGLDRARLVEFLQEEFVLVGLEARDKWEALDKLVDFYALTHRISMRDRNMIFDTIKRREEEASTALGHEAALPHGWVEHGPAIQGVLAVAPEGIEWGPDGQRVKLIVLIVTPREQEDRHLEVLAALSAMVTNDRLRNRLISAADANDAWEALESKESRDLNYFLEGDEDETPPPATAH